jgi:tetratricopeptide (TPR) repeat protein
MRNLKIFFVIIIALALFSCGGNSSKTEMPLSTKSTQAKDLYHEALHLSNILRTDKAKEKLLKAINIDTSFGAAYVMLSAFGINTGSETDMYYEKALSLSDKLNDVEKCFLEIRSSYRNNNTEKRLEYSKKLLTLIPDNALAHERMSYTYWEMANIAESRNSLFTAIQKDKNYSPAYDALRRNFMFGNPKDYNKAEEYASKALSLNNNESYYHVALGDVYRAKNKLSKAADKYDDAYEAGTNNYLSAHKAGHAYTMIDPPEARKRFDQAINDARNPGQKIGPEKWKVYTHIHENNFQKAHDQLMKLKNKLDSYGFSDEKVQEEMSDVLWHEYFIKAHTGEHDAANTALKKKKIIDLAIAKKSKNKRAINNAESFALWLESHLEIMKGDYELAKKKLGQLKTMVANENNPQKLDGYHRLMGMANLMSGNAEIGVEHFEKAVNQRNIYFTYFKGLAYKASGNIDKAKETFQYVATFNFNTLIYAPVRNRALEEVAKG